MKTAFLYPYLSFPLACFALLLAGADLHSLIAQTSQVVKAGEKFTVSSGDAVYISSALYSSDGFDNWTAIAHIGPAQTETEIWLSYFESTYVLAGPAGIVPVSDSVITYNNVTSTGFQSVFVGWTNSPVITIPAQTTCTFFRPIYSRTGNTWPYSAEIQIGGITLSNANCSAPGQLSGPARLVLYCDSMSGPFITTFQMAPSRTNVVALQAGVKAITLEMSSDLIQWQTVFQTTNFLSTRGFFLLKAEN